MLPPKSLTDIPSEIIVAGILTRLSIRDAVRTSVLSRAWRQLWRSIPDVIFSCSESQNSDAVDHVLLLHSGPICTFSLTFNLYDYASSYQRRFLRWFIALSTNPEPLRSLTLTFYGHGYGSKWHVHSALFSFRNLTSLHLHGCNFTQLSTSSCLSSAFPVLETLHLAYCTFGENGSVSMLVSSCPLLKNLRLFYVDGDGYLHIRSPSLLSLVFRGSPDGFALVCVPLLITASMRMYGHDDDSTDVEEEDVADEEEELDDDWVNECNLIKLFGHVRSIEKLKLRDNSLYYLGKFAIPVRISNTFENLKALALEADFYRVKDTLTVLCLLRSSPNLLELEIRERPSFPREIGELGQEFWQQQVYLVLPKLHTLIFARTSCAGPELEFIDYILPKAKELKKIVIYTSYALVSDDSKFKEFMESQKSFTRAEIIYKIMMMKMNGTDRQSLK